LSDRGMGTVIEPLVPPRQFSAELLNRFRAVVGDGGILSNHEELIVYECDGYVIEKKVPDVVLFPTTTELSCRDRRQRV